MSIIKHSFTPNGVKYEGVRPKNIYLLTIRGVSSTQPHLNGNEME